MGAYDNHSVSQNLNKINLCTFWAVHCRGLITLSGATVTHNSRKVVSPGLSRAAKLGETTDLESLMYDNCPIKKLFPPQKSRGEKVFFALVATDSVQTVCRGGRFIHTRCESVTVGCHEISRGAQFDVVGSAHA